MYSHYTLLLLTLKQVRASFYTFYHAPLHAQVNNVRARVYVFYCRAVGGRLLLSRFRFCFTSARMTERSRHALAHLLPVKHKLLQRPPRLD